jgi:hypothetical protein
MAKTKAMCIMNRTNKLIGIQHEKKHGKGSKYKNCSIYFDYKMIEEEEMEKQLCLVKWGSYLNDRIKLIYIL